MSRRRSLRRLTSVTAAAAFMLIALLGTASPGSATRVTFVGSGPLNAQSASATFDVSGGNLVITLTNTFSTTGSFDQQAVLGGLFFDVAGTPTLSPAAAAVTPGSSIVGPIGGNTPGQEWSFAEGNLGASLSQEYGVASTGYTDAFGHGNFCGSSRCGENADGVGWGLMPQTTADFGHARFDTIPFIQSSITFTLSGFTGDPSALISDVQFQWGTALNEGRAVGTLTRVSQPATLSLVVTALVALGFSTRRQRFGRTTS